MPLNECSLDPHHSRLTDVTDLITMTTRTSIRQPVCNHSNCAAVAEADRARDSRTDRQTEGGDVVVRSDAPLSSQFPVPAAPVTLHSETPTHTGRAACLCVFGFRHYSRPYMSDG